MSKITPWLGLFFVIALMIRFIFYPNDIYFGYDQARDSYASLEILKGDLKIVGPPSSLNEKLFHGPLIYYIYAPVYYLFNMNPEAVAALFRVINALGILIVFAIGVILFNKRVGLISALLFAVSFEQSQYSLFLSHPALAVLTVLLYYFGLSWLIFKKDEKGLVLAAIGLGLSIQFHYVNLFLFGGFLAYLIYFHKIIFKTKFNWVLLSIVSFLLTISSFLIAEFKFNFRGIEALATATRGVNTLSSIKLSSFRFFRDNFLFYEPLIFFLFLLLVLIVLKLLSVKSLRPKIVFLLIWITIGIIPYAVSGTTSYYHSPAASVSLIITISYIIYLAAKKNMLAAGILIFLILASNLNLILSQNMKGPNSDIVIQPGMLTVNEKRALDYCYTQSKGENFAVNALTIPLFVNTTWSYLFEWYGLQKYGYLPIWGGKNAEGFSGNLKVVDKRSDLPEKQCFIIEPTMGMTEHTRNSFLTEEDYFSTVLEQRQFGTIMVQLRRKI